MAGMPDLTLMFDNGPEPSVTPSVLHVLAHHGVSTRMGLSISRSIIEAHGGHLWADLNTPRGAVFQFALPAGKDRGVRSASQT